MTNTTADAVNRCKGVDVSHRSGVIDWRKVRDSGHTFAFIRTTDGADGVDPSFALNRRSARDNGLAVGFVHSFRVDTNIEAQVTNFIRALGQLEDDLLSPVLNCKASEQWTKISMKDRVELVVEWCTRVKRLLGVAPILRGTPSFFNEVLGADEKLKNFELLVEELDVEQPSTPAPWAEWTFWRSREKASIPGITGDAALNWYNGADISKAQHKRDSSGNPQPLTWLETAAWTIGVSLYFIGVITVIYEHFARHW